MCSWWDDAGTKKCNVASKSVSKILLLEFKKKANNKVDLYIKLMK